MAKEIDYDALAKKFGAIEQPAQPEVDYDALAAQYGATEQPEQQPQEQFQAESQTPSIWEQAKRAAGLTARAGIEGAGDIVGIAQNPLAAMTGGAIRRSSEVYPELATRMGLPQPETSTERLVGAGARGLVGAGTMVGAGGQLARIPGLAGEFGSVLSAHPSIQALSGTGGGLGSESVRQLGGGEYAQLAGGLLGSFSASGLGSAAKRIPSLVKVAEPQYIVPPSQTAAPTGLARALETVSGKAKTEQYATVKNQALTNQKVLKDLNMPKDAQLSPELLQNYRNQVFDDGYAPIKASGMVTPDAKLTADLLKISDEPIKQLKDFPESPAAKSVYDEVVNIYSAAQKPFDANSALSKIKELREASSKAYTAQDTSLGKSYKDLANSIEDQLGRHLDKTGASDSSIAAFKEARQKIAKSHAVEESLVGGAEGTYNVNARKLANQLSGGKYLSGGMKEIAKQASSYPRSMSIPVAGASNPLSLTDIGMGGMYGGGGAGLAALTGASPLLGAALGTALPIARPVARSIVMSQPYQRALMQQAEPVNRLSQLAYGSMGANQ